MVSSHRANPRLLIFTVAMLSALLLVVPTVSADDTRQRAQQIFVDGREHFENEEYIAAAEKFEQAYELLGVPDLLLNIGEAYRRGGVLPEAEEYFQRYLNEVADPPNEDRVVERIIEIQQQRAAERASISIETNPLGATIFVNDESEPRCQAPCDFGLDPGRYTIRAELDDHHSASEVIELEPRQDYFGSITLEAQTLTGSLVVQVDTDEANLFVEGNRYRLPRQRPVELEVGTRTIVVEANGRTISHTVEIERDQTLHLFIPAADAADFSPFQLSAIGLGGASLALTTAAIITGMQTRSTHEALSIQQERFGAVDADLVDTGRSQRRLTNGLWIGAAVTLGAGAGLWTWDMMNPSGGDSQRLEPTPQAESEDPGVDLL